MRDAAANSEVLHDLEQIHTDCKEAFVDAKKEIGTTSLKNMSVGTGYHPPTTKTPYTLSIKQYDWVGKELDKIT